MTVHSSPSGRPGAVTKRDDKRERILDAAEQIFARHGFYAAKVADVAKEAGVADGTIYLYFKSKDELLISLFERRMHQLNGALKRRDCRQAATRRTRGVHPHVRADVARRARGDRGPDDRAASEQQVHEGVRNPEFVDFLRMLGGIISARAGRR